MKCFAVVPPRKTDDWLENSPTCAFNLEARSALEFSRCTRSVRTACTCKFPARVRAYFFWPHRKKSAAQKCLFFFRAGYCSRSTIDCHTIPLVNWPKVAANRSRGTDQPLCGTYRRDDLKPADLRTCVRPFCHRAIFSNKEKKHQRSEILLRIKLSHFWRVSLLFEIITMNFEMKEETRLIDMHSLPFGLYFNNIAASSFGRIICEIFSAVSNIIRQQINGILLDPWEDKEGHWYRKTLTRYDCNWRLPLLRLLAYFIVNSKNLLWRRGLNILDSQLPEDITTIWHRNACRVL